MVYFSTSGFAARYGSDQWEADLISCHTCWDSKVKTQGDRVRAANRWLVQTCISDAAEDKIRKREPIVSVDRTDYKLCRKGGLSDFTVHSNSRALYWLWAANGKINLHTNIRLKFGPSNTNYQRASTMSDNLESCLQFGKKFWARYDISLSWQLDWSKNKKIKSPVHEVTLIDGWGRSNSEEFYYLGQAPIPKRPSERERQTVFCKTVLHEFAHLLGLDDEYFDEDCPDRTYLASEESWPFSVMANSHLDESILDFFPRHVAAVISPLCRWSD